jgi:uncharacterized protein YqfA (UPF0365 family)
MPFDLDGRSFAIGATVGAGAVLLLLLALLVLAPWVRACLSGYPVHIMMVLGMRLRGVSPALVLDACVMLVKRGIKVPTADVECTYLARRGEITNSDQLAAVVERELEARARGARRPDAD